MSPEQPLNDSAPSADCSPNRPEKPWTAWRAARGARRSNGRFSRALSVVVLVSLAAAVGAQAQEDGARQPELPPMYRVEAIVFLHEDGLSDRVRAAEPADFRGALAPTLVDRAVGAARFMLDHARRALGLEPDPAQAPATAPVAATTPAAEPPHLVNEDERVEPVPWPYTARNELSAPMQRALERLQGADAYRPLAWQAWFQQAEPFRRTAAVRLHGDEVIAEIKPPTVAEALPFFPDALSVPVAGGPDEPPRMVPLFPPRPAMPLFRLDGQIRLFHRQFLHAAPTLVWHDPVTGLASVPDGPAEPDPAGTGWLLHRLEQSRVVEPGRVEYFDSSLIGVLLRITEFEHVVPPPPPEPERAPPANASIQPAKQAPSPGTGSPG